MRNKRPFLCRKALIPKGKVEKSMSRTNRAVPAHGYPRNGENELLLTETIHIIGTEKLGDVDVVNDP